MRAWTSLGIAVFACGLGVYFAAHRWSYCSLACGWAGGVWLLDAAEQAAQRL